MIDPAAANTTNSNVEMFRALAESIEKTLTEDLEAEVVKSFCSVHVVHVVKYVQFEEIDICPV